MAGIKTIIGLSFVCLPRTSAAAVPTLPHAMLTFMIGARDRLPPRHSLLSAFQELLDTPGRRNLRSRTVTELDMRARSKPR